MWFHVLAADYDGTLATAGRIAPATVDALRRVRESGRRVVLVTGRQFADLLAVCPELDVFDLVVAENGAVLYDPRARKVDDLGPPPPAPFLTALEQSGVPFSTGRIIVSTVVPHEIAVLEAIKRLGLELQIVFNKEAVMVLPSAVSKATGLAEALRRLGMSRHNTVGVGDAENDHAFLQRTGFSVAVANAVPALAETADLVTREVNGAGVREFVVGPLLTNDFEEYRPHLLERTIELGTTDDGTPVTYPVLGSSFLITGASGSGKSTLTGVFVERLVREDYVICLLDPEGDYRTLAEHEGIVVLGSEAGTAAARAEEVERLLRHRSTSVAIDLSALDREEKVRATARFLVAVQRLRAETGAPHWVVIDEAHHLFPPGGSPAEESFDFDWRGVCLVTNEPEHVAPEVIGITRHVFSTSVEAVTRTLPLIDPAEARPPLAPGEALEIDVSAGAVPVVRRFRVARRETAHKRHVKKYATGKLPPERSFRFRGPANALNLIAHNLETFTMLANGVDPATWVHHLRNGDVARWLEQEIKDPELAEEVRALESNDDAEATRRAVLEAIARRYTPVASPEGRDSRSRFRGV